jgi:hypothetical protein
MQLLRLIVVVVTTLAMTGSYLQEVRRLSIIRRLPGDRARAYYEATRQRDERLLTVLALVLALMAAAAVLYTFVLR